MYTYDVLPAVSCMPALLLHYGQNISQKVSIVAFQLNLDFVLLTPINWSYIFLVLSLKQLKYSLEFEGQKLPLLDTNLPKVPCQ